jgi:hypothetical protein
MELSPYFGRVDTNSSSFEFGRPLTMENFSVKVVGTEIYRLFNRFVKSSHAAE